MRQAFSIATAGGFFLVALLNVGLGWLADTASADCLVSSGTCSGNCLVSVGNCSGDCDINEGTCGAGQACHANVLGCIRKDDGASCSTAIQTGPVQSGFVARDSGWWYDNNPNPIRYSVVASEHLESNNIVMDIYSSCGGPLLCHDYASSYKLNGSPVSLLCVLPPAQHLIQIHQDCPPAPANCAAVPYRLVATIE